ncbi:hypothetical protein [Paenibacillus sp. FSL R5-0470]
MTISVNKSGVAHNVVDTNLNATGSEILPQEVYIMTGQLPTSNIVAMVTY